MVGLNFIVKIVMKLFSSLSVGKRWKNVLLVLLLVKIVRKRKIFNKVQRQYSVNY